MSSRILKGVAALALAMPIAAAGISSASAAQKDPCGAITDEARCQEGGMDLKLDEPARDRYQVTGRTTPDTVADDPNNDPDVAVAICDFANQIDPLGSADRAVSVVDDGGATAVIAQLNGDGEVVGFAGIFDDSDDVQSIVIRCADNAAPFRS